MIFYGPTAITIVKNYEELKVGAGYAKTTFALLEINYCHKEIVFSKIGPKDWCKVKLSIGQLPK